MARAQTNSREKDRLNSARDENTPWRKWGPYLSERQWGTVREDFSTDGNAWDYFTHDQARSRAYRRGEDGLAGFSDDQAQLCFALALWNGNDPILKERLFGLTNAEGNHGEDVKEYYFYIDSTPTHSYMKWLYKYPHAAYPYDEIVQNNKLRSRHEQEYELLDTGIFNESRYCDVFAEYAKASPEDILVRITATNRGPEAVALHILPTIWFRNTWSWEDGSARPSMQKVKGSPGSLAIETSHPLLGKRWLYIEADRDVPLLFTENETNNQRLYNSENANRYAKDGINDCVVHGQTDAVNPAQTGTKASAHFQPKIGAGKSATIRLRLCDVPPDRMTTPFKDFNSTFDTRIEEADEFYKSITPASAGKDEALVMRQALGGMLWSKQHYIFDGDRWLSERGVDPFLRFGNTVRNSEWGHMLNQHVISMPDKWEYPWYAAWDLAFHAIALSSVDLDFAKDQLDLMLREQYMHPSGQIPAYEWNFSDVNPPVHAWGTIFLHRMQQARHGQGDVEFLKRAFGKLTANFTWWVNRKDRFGRNVFEGGFLGLDNIGVFDRSSPLPTGGHLEQADGTAWMALFSQNMLEIAIEIAAQDPGYEDLAAKYIDHFLWIANAMNRVGSDEGMWDEEDGFYYDVLRLPDGSAQRLKVRSMVGLLPMCATTVIEPAQRALIPRALAHAKERLRRHPHLMQSIHPTGEGHLGHGDRGIIALVNPDRLRRILSRMLDENEFLSPYGIRALSRAHLNEPYNFKWDNREYGVGYLPAESDSGMFGGNSNWRGPIWMPVNILIIRSLLQFYSYHGDDFQVEFPTGSGNKKNLYDVARELGTRLTQIFLRDSNGNRPVYGATDVFQNDPHWRDLILFYEYFHGDNGAGIGASHQTGWTGLVASLIQLFGTVDAEKLLEVGREAAFAR